MRVLKYSDGAVCERGNSQGNDRKVNKANKSRLCASRLNVLFDQNSALLLPPELSFIGFFTSAVTTTKDSLLKSAGCGVKIGENLCRMRNPSIVVTPNAQVMSRPATHGLANNVTVMRTLVDLLDRYNGGWLGACS